MMIRIYKIIKRSILNLKIIAILGIEQSPSCCVNYIYTNKSLNELKKVIEENNK